MKTIIREIVSRIGFDIRRIPKEGHDYSVEKYLRGEIIPWSQEYIKVRSQFVDKVLSDTVLMDTFRRGGILPDNFGYAFDERCVEYPWVLSRLKSGSETLLDAGSTFNHAFILETPALENKKLFILTLAPECDCFWHKGISYIYADLRDIPIRNDFYDTIVCISTLEHVGLNNMMFTRSDVHTEQRPNSFATAISEMRRILKPGGKIFITVPYGQHTNFGTHQVFDEDLVEQVISSFGPGKFEKWYFRYTNEGWRYSTAEECSDARYEPWVMLPVSERSEKFSIPPDRAMAARAVSCLILEKA